MILTPNVLKFHPNAEIISANELSKIRYVNKETIRMVPHDDFTMLKRLHALIVKIDPTISRVKSLFCESTGGKPLQSSIRQRF